MDYYYTTDGTIPSASSQKYTQPFTIRSSSTIKAVAVSSSGIYSYVTTAVFREKPHDWDIKLNTGFEPQYSAGGNEALIDGIQGDANWRKGNWQGYQNTDVDLVIDMKTAATISRVTAGFLQDTRAWIVAPRKLTVEVSADGISFSQVYSGENFLPIEELNVQVKKVEAVFNPVTARYVRVRALQYGKLPAWHEGAGGNTHIFTDEINIE